MRERPVERRRGDAERGERPGQRAVQAPPDRVRGDAARERQDQDRSPHTGQRDAEDPGRAGQERVVARQLRAEDLGPQLLAVPQRVRAREVDALVVVGRRLGQPLDEEDERCEEDPSQRERVDRRQAPLHPRDADGLSAGPCCSPCRTTWRRRRTACPRSAAAPRARSVAIDGGAAWTRATTCSSPSTRPTSVNTMPEHVEEHERVRVADDVLLAHAVPERRTSSHDSVGMTCPQLDARSSRRRRRPGWIGHVAHAEVVHVQVHEHVVREAVARVQPVELDRLERLQVRDGVARSASRRRASTRSRSSS